MEERTFVSQHDDERGDIAKLNGSSKLKLAVPPSFLRFIAIYCRGFLIKEGINPLSSTASFEGRQHLKRFSLLFC